MEVTSNVRTRPGQRQTRRVPILMQTPPHPSSFRKQQLHVEFASLRHAHLDGVFVCITPNDASLWVGVLFVRKGPYSSAVFRFRISFPALYPSLPPLVTFSTDIFHPLLTPLTTYTYTTGASQSETVSATDDERLPPGGFSLRHGFPQWFGRARRRISGSRSLGSSGVDVQSDASQCDTVMYGTRSPGPDISHTLMDNYPSIAVTLDYVRSTFDDDAVLDSIPVEAAANPGAFHAWQTYRASTSSSPSSRAIDGSALSNIGPPTSSMNRQPSQWNWAGVWEDRVNKAIKASLADSTLYGGATGDDIIRFRDVDEEVVGKVQRQIRSTSGGTTECEFDPRI